MLSLKLTTIAILATLTVAAPSPASTVTSISTEATEEVATKPFSFSQWVDDILNPNVVALTPEEALEAYYQSINGTTTSGAEQLSKRGSSTATCETANSKRMPVADAVYLVNTMAAGGQELVHIPIPFCSKSVCSSPSGRSSLIGQKDCNLWVEEPSEYWARAGGFIMGELLLLFLPSFLSLFSCGVGA